MRHAEMLSRKPFLSCCRCAAVVGMFVPLALLLLKLAACSLQLADATGCTTYLGTIRDVPQTSESGCVDMPSSTPNCGGSTPSHRYLSFVMRTGLRRRTHALSRQEQEVSVMRSWKPRLRFLRFLSPLLLVFLLPAGWGGRAPSAVRAADGARVLASEGMGTSGIGTLPPRPTITGHPPMMPTPCPTGMGHCPQEGVAPAQLVENGQYSDERFIDMMVPHHLMAIQMAQVAERDAEHLQRSSSWPRRSSRRRGKRSTSSRPSRNASMAPPRPGR